MSRHVPIVALLWVALGCTAAPAASAPIVEGEPAPDAPDVVAIVIRGAQLCTGTLVSPSVVLTAKHCVQRSGAEAPDPPADFEVRLGPDLFEPEAARRVVAVDATDGAWWLTDAGGTSGLLGSDVAVLTLEAPAPAVPRRPVARDEPPDLREGPVTAVGYGFTPEGGVGTRLRTTSEVSGVFDGNVVTGATACNGDSGGPLWAPDGTLAAVASVAACDDATVAGYTAIWPHVALVDAAVAAAGECVMRARAERCDRVDDDCDGTVDEGCAPLGAPCEDDEACVGLTCAETPVGRRCSEPCDPRARDGCPPGFYCAARGCDGWCVPGVAGEAPPGAFCERDTDCRGRRCADPGDGRRRCLALCRADRGDCAHGEVCAADEECGSCVEADRWGAPRGLGEPCVEDDGCRSGHCRLARCTRACDGETPCPEGFSCADGDCRSGPRARPGEPCRDDADCAAGRCVDRGVCAVPCEGGCSPGFACAAGACVPREGALGEPCDEHRACRSRLCLEGRCTRRCGPIERCPGGLACVRGATGSVCRPRPTDALAPAGGGCRVGGPTRSAPWILALVALAGIAARRRGRSTAERPPGRDPREARSAGRRLRALRALRVASSSACAAPGSPGA